MTAWRPFNPIKMPVIAEITPWRCIAWTNSTIIAFHHRPSEPTSWYCDEYPTDEAYSRKMHQHALLNLASFHYSTGGLERAQESIAEAIKIARAEGDKECLQHCVSLRNRLTAETQKSTTSIMTPGQQPVHVSDTGRDTKDATPLDELWSIKLRSDLGESVPSAFNRIHRAIGRDTAIRSTQRDEALSVPAREGIQIATKAPASTMLDDALVHGVSSVMWGMLGGSLKVAWGTSV